MSKYIDADALIEELESCSYDTWSKGINRTWWAQAVKVKDNIKQCINRQPTADVVEVVRCKDCEYWISDEIGRRYCELIDCWTGDTEFCSRGRKANDN